MQTMSVPFVQTKADIKRAKRIRVAEERRNGTVTPDFAREGLGSCNGVANPDDFTNSETRGSEGHLARSRAKMICGSCPFTAKCLTWGIDTNRTGIFGGVWLSAGKPAERM